MYTSSRIPEFYKLSLSERIEIVRNFAKLTSEEVHALRKGALDLDLASKMIENVIGVFGVPLGIATNFLINERDYLIPMATEEPSVIAAASNAAKIARKSGGFKTESTEPVMIGQIQVTDLEDPHTAELRILDSKEEILAEANSGHDILLSLGGGAKDIRVKTLDTIAGKMLIVELLIDCRDAMGANIVNSMCEKVAPIIERESGGKVYLRILSNLADKRLARAQVKISKEVLGEEVCEGIIKAYAFALADPYRAATHNKGIMNGIIAVALATGNDTRAIEAGAHAYAARSGKYLPLTTWRRDSEGDLIGEIELPLAVGIVGGVTKVHPIAKIATKILGIKSARELAEVMAAVGLAQNLAALRALVSEGIQRGHMKLHAKNVAIMAGAKGELIDKVAKKLIELGDIRLERAKELLKTMSASSE